MMSARRTAIGLDISTQTVSAMLVQVAEQTSETGGRPAEAVISDGWTASRPYADEQDRRSPVRWVEIVCECLRELRDRVPEAAEAEAVGVSTTFPGTFAVLRDGSVSPDWASLYDNTDDAGASSGRFEQELAEAEAEVYNRMSPGNMVIGLAHLVRNRGLRQNAAAALVSCGGAFAHALLRQAGVPSDPSRTAIDFTQAAISGFYHPVTGAPVPESVERLLSALAPEVDCALLRKQLPAPVPAWRNVLHPEAAAAVRSLLGLPALKAVSIGAGDSPAGVLVLASDPDTIINVRGSSDTPILVVDSPRRRTGPRETVFHYPSAASAVLKDAPWHVAVPMLRSGRVWDWVKALGGVSDDSVLEDLARQALIRRLRSPQGSLEREPLRFETALGGERAPDWNTKATGTITGLLASHNIGDIALAALEGVSRRLNACISLAEERYEVSPGKLLLAGGCTRNKLWNWLTQVFTGKKTSATAFSDASLVGAAALGYAALYDGVETDAAVSQRLRTVSGLISQDPLVRPFTVRPPDAELASLEDAYAASIR